MKNKRTYFFLSLLCAGFVNAQVKSFPFEKANCQLFNGYLYSYGICEQNQRSAVCIYKLDFSLKTLDSIIVPVGKQAATNFLQLYSDTLHNYLNVYVQKKESKHSAVLRFNKQFSLIAQLENIDIARLNNREMLGNEVYYEGETAYSVKTERDSSGKQFYLNKYQLKSDTENYDYTFQWQFPFERKNIHSARIFHADKNNVFLFVIIAQSIKAGQWILKINAQSGRLEKASKLNDKGETNAYFLGDCFIYKPDKSLHLIGHKYTEAQVNLNESRLAISSLTSCTFYYIQMDSLGDVLVKQDFKLPVNDIKTGVKKTNNSYIVRLHHLSKTATGGFSFSGDVYKSTGSDLCYSYSNTQWFNLNPGQDDLVMEKTAITPNLLIETYYESTDKLDMNGKLCIDSLSQFEKLFYKPLTLPVKQQFKPDADKNPVWVLSKHMLRKNNVNYSILKPVKKVYQVSSVEDITESLNPNFIALTANSFLISHQASERNFQLKLYDW